MSEKPVLNDSKKRGLTLIDQAERIKAREADLPEGQVKSEPNCWAKLNSLNKRFKSVEILYDVLTIGRIPDNDIQITDKRLSGKHCKFMKKVDNEGKTVIILEDTSSNGTYINGEVVSALSLNFVWARILKSRQLTSCIDREKLVSGAQKRRRDLPTARMSRSGGTKRGNRVHLCGLH